MKGKVTCRSLGNMGRLGNQMFQYAACRSHAESLNAVLEHPRWVGEQYFEGVHSRPMTCNFATVAQDEIQSHRLGIDMKGYFQNERWTSIMSLSRLKEWFRIRDESRLLADHGVAYAQPYIALHKRRGDYMIPPNTKLYATVSDDSYDNALDVLSDRCPWASTLPIVEVTEDSGRPEIVDLALLRNASVIIRGNSSFSWWAATLSEAVVMSPVVTGKRGWCDCTFVFGNDEPLCDLPGVRRLPVGP